MRLARKLVLVLCLAMLVVISLRGYLRAHEQIEDDKEQLGQVQRGIGRALRSSLTKVWHTEGKERALALLSTAAVGLRQLDIGWQVEAPSGTPPGFRGELTRVEERDQPALRTYVPVLEGEGSGWIRLSRPIEPYHRRLHAELRATAVTAGLSALFAVVISSAVGIVMVGRPMQRLVERAQRIGQGDLSSSDLTLGTDEIGALAREMDSMCRGLRAARERADRETAARMSILEQLRHADRLATIGQLASGVAHELGTPLTTILGRAKLIATGRVPPEQLQQYADAIGEQGARMTRIVRQLLDLARKGEAEHSTLDLRTQGRRTVALLSAFAAEHRVSLKLEPSAEPVFIRGNAAQIEQVLSNLIINAVQASPAGASVQVSVDPEEIAQPPGGGGARRFARLTVSDQGSGILPDQSALVFEPFYTTKPVGVGTGLGLAIADGIVREHGGWIALESNPGRGTQFFVRLPCAASERCVEAEESAHEQPLRIGPQAPATGAARG